MSGKLKDFITTEEGYQYSVNVKYDLRSDKKVAHYIPLTQSLEIIKDVMQANYPGNSQRSRLIIGSYGTGKSHLSTVLLSMLGKIHSIEKYNSFLDKIPVSSGTREIIEKELKSEKLLPIVINGDNKSFDQSLLIGLLNALEEAEIKIPLPNNAYYAALKQISDWRDSYPAAYNVFINYLSNENLEINKFIKALESFSNKEYKIFESAYKQITHGANFQPLLNSKVEDVYIEIVNLLPKEYKGIVVLFDEFGKYLESQWDKNGRLDLKEVQDFAEACNSSSEKILQLIFVTHKPIAQYAAKQGQEMVNEWRKVEGRFKTIEIINQPSKVYELISQIIIKDSYWNTFRTKFNHIFEALLEKISNTRLFSELNQDELNKYIVDGAYPLQPITTFCLPRFSQKVAQNERTIFTFLATNDFSSLGGFLENNPVDDFNMLTVDMLFDYFVAQMKDIDSQDQIFQIWVQTNNALGKLSENEKNEARVLKALAIIKIINLQSVLPPTQDSIRLAFIGSDFREEEVAKTLINLFNKKILFEGPSTGNLEIIESGEIDVENEVSLITVKRKGLIETFDFLNKNFTIRPILAKRYNDIFTMTRYFTCVYSSLENAKKAEEYLNGVNGLDGVIYYIIPKNNEDRDEIVKYVNALEYSAVSKRLIFIVPNPTSDYKFEELELQLRRYDALLELVKQIDENKNLQGDRIEVLLWLKETETKIKERLNNLFNLELCQVLTKANIHPNFKIEEVNNTPSLSRLVSTICNEAFPLTPKFNNEMINKHVLTTPIVKARQKVVDGLLNQFLKPRLGIIGNGPELAIYKALLYKKGLVRENEEEQLACLTNVRELEDKGLVSCLSALNELLINSNNQGISFEEILMLLCNPPFGIRKGIIPILIAVLLHEQKKELLLTKKDGSEVLFSAQGIEEAFKDPKNHMIIRQDWSEEKDLFSQKLSAVFIDYIDEGVGLVGPAKLVMDAMKRWFLSLPRFTRDSKSISIEAKKLRLLIKQDNIASAKFLFNEIPIIFGENEVIAKNLDSITLRIISIKEEYDSFLITSLDNLEKEFINHVPDVRSGCNSLLGALRIWYLGLDSRQKEKLYSDGTQELMDIVANYSGENSLDFLKQVLLAISGLRPEDWNDITIRNITTTFKDMILEVESFKEIISEFDGSKEVIITLTDNEGKQLNRTFIRSTVSSTGELLQNVLESYIDEYGDAITKNEKRQVLLNLLERLIS